MAFAIYSRSNTFCAFISHDDQDEGRKEGKDASPLSLPRQFHDDDAQQEEEEEEEEEVEARDAAIKSQLVSKNSARNG